MLNNLKPTEGSRSVKTRRCRGLGSGLGKTGGCGQKGQNSRSGGGVRLGFEGGQMPIYRRLPKRGFKNLNRLEYAVINLADLNRFNDGDEITITTLLEAGLINKEFDGLKILGNGELTKKVTIVADKFTKTALAGIEKAGAKAVVLEK